MSKYNWKLPSFGKNIDADEAVKELEKIENIYGSLTAESILQASQDANSILHPLFVWDDSEAAILYRKHQARTILNNIQINVISDGEPKKIDVYEIVFRDEKKVYKHVQDFTTQDINNLKGRTLRDLNVLKNKLSFYQQFNEVIPKIEELTALLQAV